MPFVSVKMLEGRTKEQKRKLIKSISKSVSDSLSIDESHVWVVVEEFPADEWGLGGEIACDRIKSVKEAGK